MLLRAAMLEGNFPEISQAGGETQEWPSGYIPYIFGVEFLQWLKDRHGAEKVEKFTEYTAREPFPFFPFYPRLNHNAKKAFGKSFYSLWREWRKDLQQKYGDQKLQVESFGMTPIERLTKHGSLTQA